MSGGTLYIPYGSGKNQLQALPNCNDLFVKIVSKMRV